MPDIHQRIAVTGATGFIGKTLCSRLTDQGFLVSALVRDTARAATLAEMGVTLINGSLDDKSSLRSMAENSDIVIHCAGAVRGNSQDAFNHTNVRGFAHLLDTMAEQSQPPKLLLISSLAAREPELSWYARSKYEAELLLQNCSRKIEWDILRPPPVYGPGDKEMLPVFQWMARGLAPVPGECNARISLIHVEDVVAAIIAIIQQPRLANHTFTLDDGKTNGYSWYEMADEVAAVWQRRVRLFNIPKPVLNIIAAANLALSRALGYAPMLTPPKLRELRHPDWVVDNSELTAATGWQPQINLRAGLEELKDSVL